MAKKRLTTELNTMIDNYGLSKVCSALEKVKSANGYIDTESMTKYLTPRQVERAKEEREIYELYAKSGMGKCEFLEFYNKKYGKSLNRQRLYYIINKEGARSADYPDLIKSKKK